MKQLLAISLFILITWQTIFNAGFIIYWKINQNYITKALCENKNKPQMHCNGKCYLYKQLKKAKEKENNKNDLPTGIPKYKSVGNFLIQNNDLALAHTLIVFQKHLFTSYSANLLIGQQNPFFIPPEFI